MFGKHLLLEKKADYFRHMKLVLTIFSLPLFLVLVSYIFFNLESIAFNYDNNLQTFNVHENDGDKLAFWDFSGVSSPWFLGDWMWWRIGCNNDCEEPPKLLEDITEDNSAEVTPIPSFDLDSYIFSTDDPEKINFRIEDDLIESLVEGGKGLVVENPHYKISVPYRTLRELDTANDGYKVLVGHVEETEEKDDIIAQMLLNDSYVKRSGNIYKFTLFSIEEGDSVYYYDIIEEFITPITIKLKNVKDMDGMAFNNFERTGVFYLVPEYDEDGDLISVDSKFSGNAQLREDVIFTTDHFSFFVVKERDGIVFADQADVDTSYARDAIQKLSALKILRGNMNGDFKPAEQMQRTHFAIALNNTLGKIDASYEADLYEDIDSDDYFAGPIARLNVNRIPDTFGKDSFGVYINDDPNQGRRNITRQEAAVFMANSYDYSSRFMQNLRTINPASINYNDLYLVTGRQEHEAISIVTQIRLMQGWFENGNRVFVPNSVLTREQCASILSNFLDLYNRGLTFDVNVN